MTSVRQTSWTGVAVASVLLQTAAVWELFRTRTAADGDHMPLSMLVISALILTSALWIRERRRSRTPADELAADKFRDGQEQLTGIVKSATNAIIVVDDEQRITVFNPAAEVMFGCTAADACGTTIDRFLPPPFRAQLTSRGEPGDPPTAPADRALKPLLLVCADGRQCFVEASVVVTGSGSRTLHTFILRDDTERRKAEAALQESEERFRIMADTAPMMVWMSGPDKPCTYLNKLWLDFTGRTLDDELGNGWQQGIHPDDISHCVDIYEAAFDQREKFSMEYRLRHHDGSYRWILDNGVPRFTPDGGFAGYVGCCVDVTSHKMAEAALSSLSQKLIEAHESERSRIARDLHDDVAQRMAVLTIELDRLDQALPLSVTELRTRFKTVSARALDLAKDVQAMSHRLHSSKLEYLGVVAASDAFCRELSEQQHVEVDFSGEHIPRDLPKDVALCLFRSSTRACVTCRQRCAAAVTKFSSKSPMPASVSIRRAPQQAADWA
jgi:PAS domain S-box-containing protein